MPRTLHLVISGLARGLGRRDHSATHMSEKRISLKGPRLYHTVLKKECNFCDLTHYIKDPKAHWKTCFNVIPSLKRYGGSPNPNATTQAEVTKRIAAEAGLKDVIAEYVKKLKHNDPSSSPTPETNSNQQAGGFVVTTIQAGHITASVYALRMSILLDNYSTQHIFNDITLFVGELTHDNPTSVWAGEGASVSQGVGTVKFTASNGFKCTLYDVYYIPGFQTSVVSLNKMKAKNCHWQSFTQEVRNMTTGALLFKTTKHFGQPCVSYVPVDEEENEYPDLLGSFSSHISPQELT
ncbi:hypothetical protein B0J13DRAFT_533333 [Dactylonectria estremocensis]|uniref:Retrovirus-related Pol polyprotein from transposon TNT 1-94-like beta-barrel domain-containing protein n=1 Tax=Dactylonectria estremocensis TaxID=1079267 RepID=A0A9P9DA38_9HYPO|nr:hypothetical protein B0J13DRAFT_533333 [Dactylonectria estremocensis]